MYNKKSWLFMTRKIGRLINESAFVSLKYVTWRIRNIIHVPLVHREISNHSSFSTKLKEKKTDLYDLNFVENEEWFEISQWTTHTFTYIYIHTHIHIYTHIYRHIHIYIYIYTHTYIYIHTHIYTHTHTYIYIYICIYVHARTHIYTHTHIYMCTHSHTHTHTHIYIYIYLYIVIHRQTVSFYQNSSVCLDTQDARRWDQNPSNFTLDCVSDHSSTKRHTYIEREPSRLGLQYIPTASL